MNKLIEIKNMIHNIRGKQVMLDRDLAELYEVETRRLNEQVKRNRERFPDDFMFRLTKKETDNLMSQNAISNSEHGGRRKLPYVFTEQGVSMLSGVLRSKVAVEVNIKIMRAFISMRRFLSRNAGIFQRLNNVERKQLVYDKNFEKVFDALETKEPKQGIFYDGQIFDAYKFVSDLIRKAEKRIILIDNFIDDTVLTLFTKRKKNVEVTIYTKEITKQLKLDIKKHNKQYEPIKVKFFKKSHDRFLIIDDCIYHFGASMKDLGRKWFCFSKLNINIINTIEKELK